MRIKHAKKLTTLLVFLMVLVVLSTKVFAGSMSNPGLQVSIELSGTPPTEDEDYTIEFKADNSDYPMPEGSVDRSFKMTITGEGKKPIPEIEYSSVGEYTYKINQLPGENELATYDDRVYDVVVFVTNAENGKGFDTTFNVYLEGVGQEEDKKQHEVVFENYYKEKDSTPVIKPKPTPTPPKTTPGVRRFQQTSTSTIGLGLFGLLSVLGIGFAISKKKK